MLLSIIGCAAQTQSDAQPAAAEPAADTSQPTQDSVSAADGDTVTIGRLPVDGDTPLLTKAACEGLQEPHTPALSDSAWE